MHNAIGVGVRERLGNVLENPQCFAGSDLSSPKDSVAQRLSPNVRHDVVRKIVRLAGTQHGDDVCLLQSNGEANLAREAFDRETKRQIGPQHLYYDFTVERSLFSQKHARHASATELTRERVMAPERLGE